MNGGYRRADLDPRTSALSAGADVTFSSAGMSAFALSQPKADEVDCSRSRHLGAKMGYRQANPSKGATRHGY